MSSIHHNPPPRPTDYIIPSPQRLLINLLWLFGLANVRPAPTTLRLLSSWPLIDIFFRVNNPLRKGNYFTSLCIGSFDESDRRKLYGLVIRIPCECREIWCRPLGVQCLDQRIAEEGGPLDGREIGYVSGESGGDIEDHA